MEEELWEEQPEKRRPPPRRRRRRKRHGRAVLTAAILVCLGMIVIPSLGSSRQEPAANLPAASAPGSIPGPTQAVAAVPKPTPAPAPTPVPYDYSAPAPASEAVGMDYFADAVFIGDSRTDGLQLYSGITGTTFLSYKGITVFDVMERTDKKVIKLDGQKYTILEALAKGTYSKVYVSLGINELGYQDSRKFVEEYGKFIDKIRELQPGAEIYIQNLVPVNPEKCTASKQPVWLTNIGISYYNTDLKTLCAEKQVIFLTISEALVDENGILPAEATGDGLHFTKSWYKKWLDYLMTHTVDLT